MLIEVEQGSDEWLVMRAGMVTASRVADVVTKLKKGGYSAARQQYLMEVVTGRLTGLNPETYVSQAMEYGIEQEQYARAAYEILKGDFVDAGGFAIHDKIKWFGASPDGLVGSDGLIEIKCPNSTTHLGYIMAGVPPADYQPQMLAEMVCTGRKWVDFISFDSRMPKKLQLFVCRFHWDEAKIAEMEHEVEKFLEEVDLTIKRLESQDLTAILKASLEAVA